MHPPLTLPGLFITATDTEVGKTVITCAIATVLRRAGWRVGVCKPIATGCRHDREGLVSEDAEALAHFSDCRLALDVINPVRYRSPVAPAVAAEQTNEPVSDSLIAESLRRIEAQSEGRGKGTTFTVRLPLATRPVGQITAIPPTPVTPR